jgi:hypothetical protein
MVQNPWAIAYRTRRVAQVPLAFTSGCYGGAGYLAADAAAPGLDGLEATFEHGPVGAFNFDLVNRAAISDHHARVAGCDGCVIPVITVEQFVSIGFTGGEFAYWECWHGTSVRRESKEDRCHPVFVESNDTGIALRRSYFRDRHGFNSGITLRIGIERRRRLKAFHIAELPPAVRNFEFCARAGYNGPGRSKSSTRRLWEFCGS